MNYLSSKFNFERGENDLAKILTESKTLPNFIDLTSSNPTSLFVYDLDLIQSAFINPSIISYKPDPQGLKETRLALVDYYQKKGRLMDVDQFFLTSGTSEAMSFILKTICDTGSEVLVPTPGYPLYDFLLVMENVKSVNYSLVPRLTESQNKLIWEIDFEILERNINRNTKAIIIVEPNNPTGSRLTVSDSKKLVDLCQQKNLVLIVDEVFSDYYKEYYLSQPFTKANCIFLNGISKTLALPQMKLSWMYLSGEPEFVAQLKEGLEIVADSFLSVNMPVQLGLGKLLEGAEKIQSQIRERIYTNCTRVKQLLKSHTEIDFFLPDGGWYLLLKINTFSDDEEFACKLLKNNITYVFPGYMFDLEKDCFIVISLIVPEEIFEEGIKRIIRFTQESKQDLPQSNKKYH
ncbi:MAG: pyridoxal phosphate-dependent aminotransferase [Leptospiraceae bacterium]|nr:pyridoxal phosphate-dependent aminotransferase [Leptospiraceae bacterium]